MALTATATVSLKYVIKTLGMKDTVVINENINKPNIIYSVRTFESMESTYDTNTEKGTNKNAQNYSLLSTSRQLCAALLANENDAWRRTC